jgi:predicted RNA-binding Zn-ribbon protein involved in translation (DUF1610 family)
MIRLAELAASYNPCYIFSMSDDAKKHDDEHEHPQVDAAEADFTCPSCGTVEREDVVFLCNTCSQSEMLYKNGMYMCPSCLNPGQNFECMKCGSKKVEMELKK